MRTRTNEWVAVVGTRSEGREEVLRALGGALARRGVSIGGFLQSPLRAGHDLLGYDVESLATGERVPLARDSRTPELCNWGFEDAGFARARRLALEGPHSVAFCEAGRLEAAERGHWPTILSLLATRPLTVVGIRRGVLAAVALRLPDPFDALELPVSRGEIERFVERVATHCSMELSA